ncbi:hypothetical protein DAETH_12830 [Deinococcus aetherius]|uniref:Uncharacterized protein n=1 Tax=Deinococcus aetherius TaxID=200252 RepID=A0ABN6REK7_9DEIO|nr:hypothetical protein DAETH_12830 [Deinococcus aetherius]
MTDAIPFPERESREMIDVRLPIGDSIFCVRAVILCLRDEHLLVDMEKDVDFLYPPGGAILVAEATPGLPAGPLRLVGGASPSPAGAGMSLGSPIRWMPQRNCLRPLSL